MINKDKVKVIVGFVAVAMMVAATLVFNSWFKKKIKNNQNTSQIGSISRGISS